MKNNILARRVSAIDIGTTKICVLIAQVDVDGSFDIIGVGKHPSHGLKKGVVVNIAKTVDSIKAAVEQAQEMANAKVEAATVGISGGHIKSYNSTGVVAVKGSDVTQYDVNRVIEAAKAIPLPQDQEILHILPQYFRVDGQEYVLDSVGMYGVRLDAQVHIITGAVSSAQNIINSCERAGVSVSDIVLEQLASGDAVLTESESEMGAGIIDIGGGTSDLAIYKDGRIRHTKVLPVAGNHFTNDLAIGLGIPIKKAEELKKQYGAVQAHNLDSGITHINVDLGYDNGSKKIELSLLHDILCARAEEIFEIFNDEIEEYKLKRFMPSGIILTGGGSLLEGIREVAAEKMGMPVRIGLPMPRFEKSRDSLPAVLKSPIYSTAYGLLVYATGQRNNDIVFSGNEKPLVKVFKRMKSWIYDFL